MSSLSPGVNYKFKIETRNLVGSSELSSEVVIRAAELPTTPIDVVTSAVSRDVIISWTEQSDGGSPILEYVVLILENDGVTWTRDTVNCPGTDSTALDTH